MSKYKNRRMSQGFCSFLRQAWVMDFSSVSFDQPPRAVVQKTTRKEVEKGRVERAGLTSPTKAEKGKLLQGPISGAQGLCLKEAPENPQKSTAPPKKHNNSNPQTL